MPRVLLVPAKQKGALFLFGLEVCPIFGDQGMLQKAPHLNLSPPQLLGCGSWLQEWTHMLRSTLRSHEAAGNNRWR